MENLLEQALILIEDAKKKDSDRVAVRTNSLAQTEDGELIVGAQELAERLLELSASAGGKPESAELTASRLKQWLGARSTNTGNPTASDQSGEAADNTPKGATQSQHVATRQGYLRPTFRWRGVSGATRYALCVFGPPYGMDDIVFLRGNIIGTSFTLPFHLEERVTYRWTVCAGSATGWGKPFPYRRCNG